jgi:hypothetical protein
MLDRITSSLETIVLGETAVINGVRVKRRSLLGFEVAGGEDLLDARAAARKIGALAKCRPARIAICSRCSGDGLGRRNRGTCGLCHGQGIQAALPPLGWRDAPPAEVASAVDQALSALRATAYPRARASLVELLREALPAAEEDVLRRGLGELRRQGLSAEAAAIEAGLRGPRAA